MCLITNSHYNDLEMNDRARPAASPRSPPEQLHPALAEVEGTGLPQRCDQGIQAVPQWNAYLHRKLLL